MDDMMEQRLKRLEARLQRLEELLREWLGEDSMEHCSQIA